MLKTIISAFALLITSVSGNCSPEDIAQFQQADFTQRILTFSLRKSTKKTLGFAVLVSTEQTLNSLMPKATLDLGVSAPCTECFVQNVMCAAKHCGMKCRKDPLSSKCRECVHTHCMAALLDCVGPEAAANMPGEPTAEHLHGAAATADDDSLEI